MGNEQTDWSEPRQPNKYCPYDHIFIDTPLGRIQIEWKSWKDYVSYTVHLNDAWVESCSTLEEAKEASFNLIKDKFNQLKVWLTEKQIGLQNG